jgi:hypothetical protein
MDSNLQFRARWATVSWVRPSWGRSPAHRSSEQLQVGCVDRLLEIIDPARRAMAGTQPPSDLELAPRTFGGGNVTSSSSANPTIHRRSIPSWSPSTPRRRQPRPQYFPDSGSWRTCQPDWCEPDALGDWAGSVTADWPRHYPRLDQRWEPHRFPGDEPGDCHAWLAPRDRPDIPFRSGKRGLPASRGPWAFREGRDHA